MSSSMPKSTLSWLSLVLLLFGAVSYPTQASSPNESDPQKSNDNRTVATEPAATADTLLKSFQSAYGKFSKSFESASDSSTRQQVIERWNADIKTLLSPHLQSAAIAKLLPKLEHVLLIDLESTFVGVIDTHPQREVRALALYSMARYYGNNQKTTLCKGTLGFLARFYGDVEYQGESFGHLAEESEYFFEHLAVGCTAPQLIGNDEDGQLFRLSDYRGKVVMLRFWGDWCPACRAMYPYERELVEKFRNKPFALLGVNSDPKPTLTQAQKRKNLVWRSFWDGGDTGGPIAQIYKVDLWPTVVIIDGEGIIRARFDGFDKNGATRRRLDKTLEKLLQEPAELSAGGVR